MNADEKTEQQLLAEENRRLKARLRELEAVVNDPQALWINWLRQTVKLPNGIGDVRQFRDHIRRLEEAGDRLADFSPPQSDRVGAWTKAKEEKP